MNIPMLNEKRGFHRRRLTGLLPGRLAVKGSDHTLDCKPVDISPEGLGIVTGALLPEGTQMTLNIKGEEILFEISWGQPDFGKRDLFRYGLKVLSNIHNIEDIFMASGCLK